MIKWLLLGVAICAEVCGTTALKFSNGFSKPLPSLLVVIFYGASFFLFSRALKQLEISIAYAIWAGAGVALVAMIGFIFFNEQVSIAKTICLVLIIIGVIGLSLLTKRPLIT